jgi:tetratricopeptide (TPR) repeat protein
MLFCHPLLWSQETDPFYRRLFREGEKSYLDKNYRQAIKELEVAVFGLKGDKNLVGKAYVYLSLSYFRLKDREKCELNIRKAVDLLGPEGLKNLAIDQSARGSLERLMDYFRIGKTEETEEEKPSEKRPPKKPEEKVLKSRVEELEERLEAEPQNLALYYELYEFHRGKNDVKAARKVIQDLVENNPDELIGSYLLGKIEYSQNNYAEALGYFNQVLKPFEGIETENDMVIKSLIYVSLCLHHLNRQDLHESFINLIKDHTSEEQLRLMLKEEELDKEWEGIIREEKQEPSIYEYS